MRFIIGKDRKQAALFPVSLEESIEIENEVRGIELFVNSLDLEKMGFKVHFPEGGRPAYHPAVLLKLFIYGYLNRWLFRSDGATCFGQTVPLYKILQLM
jgi:transposase